MIWQETCSISDLPLLLTIVKKLLICGLEGGGFVFEVSQGKSNF